MDTSPSPLAAASTLVDVLRTRALLEPAGVAYVYLVDGEAQELRLTYGELDEEARAIAAALRSSLREGDRALLLYPAGLDYVKAFFGCLYAGVVGVCAYPPPIARGKRLLPRLRAILADSAAKAALTTREMLAHTEAFLAGEPGLGELRWVTTDGAGEPTAGAAWREPEIGADSLAFLMYTSGSTGTPKGVMVSHGNAVHNLSAFRGFEQRLLTASVSWLPLFHDLGLVFGVLHPLYQGKPAILMPPEAFVRRPARWLQALSRYRASATFGPNFAYDLCARRITAEERAGLDLSSCNFVLNGSEPVRWETIERFTTAFALCGFRRAAFYPAFGLSEGTSDVSGNATFAEPLVCALRAEELERHRVVEAPDDEGAQRVVGCGALLPGQRAVIVDPETLAACPPDGVGEVWLQGPSVALGYWGRPDDTEETFRARLAGSCDGPFLRTGDLGFLHCGELFITGRFKDLIIIRGINHYPHDLELTAEQAHPALRPGCGAAFALDVDGEERSVLVQEIEDAPGLALETVYGDIRQRLVDEHEVDPWGIVLIRAGSLPKTSSGKIQRRACREAFLAGELELVGQWTAGGGAVAADAGAGPPPVEAAELQARLIAAVARRGGIDPGAVDPDQPLARYGLTSVESVALAADLESWLGRPLSPTLVWEHPTIGALVRHLAAEPGAAAPPPIAAEPLGHREPVAIVGMACRFPGAPDLGSYWRLLRDGVDAVTPIPPERWDADALYDADPAASGKMITRNGGFLSGLDRFEPLFFGISPREAAHLDPRQRLMLELTWEALEHAGIPPGSLAGSRAGVFVATLTDDFVHLLYADLSRGDAYSGTGGANSLVANRISYCFDLKGPSLAVDTACSGSLVAIHLACQSLWSGESDAALAGGVMLNLKPDGFLFFSKAGALAPDGRCKPFDARADGIGRAEGAGLLVLKPLSRALADGDRVIAVVRGSAVNQDGTSNGLTAPHGPAQEAVLRDAYRRAGVPPASVQYVEAHGTGTRLGDPIEVAALAAVLGEERAPGDAFSVGTVKSNFGHAEAAAGVAGVIKVALAMQHRLLPASLHFEEPNPLIPFDWLPLRVQQDLGPWPAPEAPLIAGVSGFGIGGTNAHVVLEEAPAAPAPAAGDEAGWHLLPLSARTPQALAALAREHARFLTGEGAGSRLRDICYTASVRRDHHPYRLAVPARTHAEAASALASPPAAAEADGVGARPRLVMLFSGQGSQWPRMGWELARREPIFREALERCAGLFPDGGGRSLLDELAAAAEGSRLGEPDLAQRAIFALQVAQFELWRSWGIVPDAIGGHSLGEAAAAYACGALSLAEAARVVDCRARLMQGTVGLGLTAVVELPHAEVLDLLAGRADLEVAGVSGPATTVVSGATAAVEELLAELGRREVRCRLLHNSSMPLHSRWMEPLRQPLAAALADLRPRAAAIPFHSAVTGGALAGERLDAHYWARNLREPFRLVPVIEGLAAEGRTIFLEVSPHPVLGPALRATLRHLGREGPVLSSLRRGEDERGEMLASLGELYAAGRDVEWRRLFPVPGRVVHLPSYPWQRESYWFATARREVPEAPARRGGHPLLGEPLVSAVAPQRRFWEVEVGAGSPAWLADHRVRGAAVLPAAFWLELALAAAARALPPGARGLAEVRFLEALFLSGRELRKLQLVVTPEAGGTALFEALSREAESGPWVCNAAGRIVAGGPPEASAGSKAALDALRERCLEPLSVAEHYRAMAERGLDYGPAFRAIRSLGRGGGEALAELRLDAALEREAASYLVHPALLDAGFQVAAACLADPAGPAAATTYLPAAVERIRVLERPGAHLWCHAELRSRTDDRVVVDLRLLAPSGELAAEVAGLCLKRAGHAAAGPADDELLYRIDWPQVADAAGERAPLDKIGDWLVVGGGELASALATELRGHGVGCRRIAAGERPAADPAEPAPYRRALVDFRAAAGPGRAEIVFLGALNEPAAIGGQALEDLLHLVQAAAALDPPPRLWVVTRGAQPAGQQGLPAPGQAPLWGLARSCGQQEHPELWGGLIDLDPAAPPYEAGMLYEQIADARGEDQVAFRGGARRASRLRREAPAAAVAPVLLRPDASYLVTGGLGALGLRVARWLVARGARRLVLMSRSGLPPRRSWSGVPPQDPRRESIAVVRELEAAGASVHLAAVDVADEPALRGFLGAYEEEAWPPIRGIVHAAGVLDDRLLLRMDAASLDRVLRPKLRGAWLLHRWAAERPLDLFVLFSSLSSLLPPPGQGNYAAANAFLDALAHHRRALGLPGVSIGWGPWAESGMAARPGARRAEGAGIFPLPPERALRALERALAQDAPQLVVAAADWERVREDFFPRAAPPLLADLVPPPAGPSRDAAHLAEAPETGGAQVDLEARLREMAAGVLRMHSSRLDPRQPLSTLGLDSIMAVELRATVESSFGVTLPMRMLLDAPSISQLASRLANHMEQGA
ncbi:MAG TPA: type I polyketide synthase [Thermoanaerobaculia bacterium]|nr:type I polyketide synthase [Thermoanaerobaculia bacterium]